MRFTIIFLVLLAACGEIAHPLPVVPDTVVVEVVITGVTQNPSDPAYYWCSVTWTARVTPRTATLPYYAIIRQHTPTGDSQHPLGSGTFSDSVRHGLFIQSDARYPYPWTVEWNFGAGYPVWGITRIEGGCVEGATTLGAN